jgi:hypothetical protein
MGKRSSGTDFETCAIYHDLNVVVLRRFSIRMNRVDVPWNKRDSLWNAFFLIPKFPFRIVNRTILSPLIRIKLLRLISIQNLFVQLLQRIILVLQRSRGLGRKDQTRSPRSKGKRVLLSRGRCR